MAGGLLHAAFFDWAYVSRRGDFVRLSPDLGGAEVKPVSFDRHGEARVQLERTAFSDEQAA